MTPLVYNPDWDRQRLWEEASKRVVELSQEWNVPIPTLLPEGPRGGRRWGSGGTLYGYWRAPGTIWVNVPKATTPPRTRGRIWSYPGYKTDRTVAGILFHEFGHHVWYHINGSSVNHRNGWQWHNLWLKVVKNSKPVTSYEPIPEEAWAESMRIFALNPDLLKNSRPTRFQFINSLLPRSHNLPWDMVLTNAPEFIKQAARNFCFEQEGRRINATV